MQLTIDTKHDSPDEIKKAIKMLMSLTGEVYTNEVKTESKNLFEQETDMSGMMNLFNSPEKKKEEATPEMQFY